MSGHAQQVALAMARPSARRETLVQDISGRGVMLPECGSLPVPRYLARVGGDHSGHAQLRLRYLGTLPGFEGHSNAHAHTRSGPR